MRWKFICLSKTLEFENCIHAAVVVALIVRGKSIYYHQEHFNYEQKTKFAREM